MITQLLTKTSSSVFLLSFPISFPFFFSSFSFLFFCCFVGQNMQPLYRLLISNHILTDNRFIIACNRIFSFSVKPIEHAAKFDGKAFIVFSADEFPHLTSERDESLDLRFKTSADFGVRFLIIRKK